MKRLASLAVLALVALLGVPTGPVDTASAAAPSRFQVKVDRTELRGGQTLTATGTASSDCAWIIDWNNERRSRSARSIVARFVAPEVEKKTVIPLRGTCFYVSPAPPTPTGPQPPAGPPGQASQTVTVTVPKSLNQTILVTVLPSGTVVSPPDDGNGNGGGPGGDLPDTGGPDLWILLAGVATLLVGASLIRLATSQDGRLQVLR